MKLIRRITLALILASFGAPLLPAEPVRVGTFDKPSVVLAFYRSPQWAGILKAKMAEMDAAKKANDTKKIEELNAWGGASQEMAHKQLEGKASIANILEVLAPAFPEIARKAQVSKIDPEVTHATADVQPVDVTVALMDWLKADDTTRKMAKDLRERAAAK
jgi:hypothetical protein